MRPHFRRSQDLESLIARSVCREKCNVKVSARHDFRFGRKRRFCAAPILGFTAFPDERDKLRRRGLRHQTQHTALFLPAEFQPSTRRTPPASSPKPVPRRIFPAPLAPKRRQAETSGFQHQNALLLLFTSANSRQDRTTSDSQL